MELHYTILSFSVFQDPTWHGILNSPYARPKPQLFLSLTLEAEGVQSLPSNDRMDRAMSKSTSGLALTLDPSGGFYQLGPVGVAHQEMFMLSLTLQNPKDLPPVRPLGHNVRSQCF